MVRTKQAVSNKSTLFTPQQGPSNLRIRPAFKTARYFVKKSVVIPKVKKTVVINNDEELQEQKTVFCIPRRSFQLICKELSYQHLRGCRWAREALEALQVAVEDYMTGFFEDAVLCMEYAKRQTMMKKDLELVCHLRQLDYVPL